MMKLQSNLLLAFKFIPNISKYHLLIIAFNQKDHPFKIVQL